MSGDWVLDEDDALELLAYLITAARTQVDEAAEYGPMRLLIAAHRLGEMMVPRSSDATDAFVTGRCSRCRCWPCPGTTVRATSLASTVCAAPWPST